MFGTFIESIFEWILNQSIPATWLILAVILVRVFMKKSPKTFRYVLWAFVAVRLLCPIAIESDWSLVPDIDISSQKNITDKNFDSVAVEDFEKPDISGNPEVPEHQQNDLQNMEMQNSDVPDKVIEVLPEEMVDISENIADRNNSIDKNTDKSSLSEQEMYSIVSRIWLIGMFGFVLTSVISVLRLRRKVDVSLQMGENLWVCDDIQSPFIFGLLSPRIYAPSFVTEEQLPCILAHEKEHLKYRDHLWKPIGFAILTLYWFHPLVWAAYILFCRDIELACDERVIRHMNEEEKKQYSKSLLLCNNPRHLISACPVAFGEIGVKERIKRILDYKKPSAWIVGIAVIVCVLIAACFMTNQKTNSSLDAELPEDTTKTENSTDIEKSTEAEDLTENVSGDSNLNKYLEIHSKDALSKEEIEWFETEFFNREDDRMPNMFLTSNYDKPENINLNHLFYGGADGLGGGAITEEEKNLLHQRYYADDEWMLDMSKTTADEMNSVLEKYMNISLENTNKLSLENLHYLPEYDAYYKVAGDSEYAQYQIMAGWRNEDETISLVYLPANKSVVLYYQVTLKQEGDNYYFISNLQLPMDIEVYESKKITEEEALQMTSDTDGQIYTTMLDEKNGYALRCSSPALSQMSKVLCKTSDGGNTFEEYLDVSVLQNYPNDVYFFTEEIGYIVTDYHSSDNFLYRTEDGGKTWRAQMLYIPGSWYRYVNGISIENGVLQIEVVLDDMSIYYEYIASNMGETWDIVWSRSMTNLSTIDKQDVENWGVTLAAENITSTGLTLKCTQSGANPIGELQTGSWYILEEWTQEYGWMEVDYLPQEYEPVWTQESWMVPMNGSCEWEVNWEWLYGKLPTGKYRIGKEIAEFRGPGDYDEAVYYAEFEIVE